MKNKEAVFGALSSLLRAEGFEGKRRFIAGFDGLEFLESLMKDEVAENSLRLYNKVLLLLDDLVTNDDTIFKSRPFAVRDHCLNSEPIMQ